MDPITLAMGVGVAGTATAGSTAAAGTLAGVGMGATLAGGFMAAVGDIFGGKAASAQANYQSGLALTRARVAQQNAQYDIAAGETNAYTQGIKGGQVAGQIKAGQGASNINVAGGSSADVRASQTRGTQFSEAVERTNAARRAYGQEVQAATDVSQASAYSAEASTAKTASYLGAAAGVLGAGGKVASQWYQAQREFGPSGQQQLG